MELGISTASYFGRMHTEDALLDIGARGVRTVELFLNSFSEYTDAFAELLAERLRRANLSVFSVHPLSTQFEPQLFSRCDRQREDALGLYEQVLRLAEKVGATHYVMHGAASLAAAGKGENMARSHPAARIAGVLTELISRAEDHGVVLTLENVSWCAFRTPAFGAELRDATDGRLKFTLDVKQAVRSGYSPEDYVRAIGKDIVSVHLCDAHTDADGMARLALPGNGDCDFAALFSLLRSYGFAGPAFIEVYSDMYETLPELYRSYEKMRALIG